ncbi:beta-ketoacyl synthase N-terminal-like domain-containing protein [Kitasatospora cineracea]|uniref:beta-ketoacyl synthase N-terminal-like domain-containing protein n=1 Tax=Kitasatospora cineracea TaxID=88074 RepID=UPI0037F34F5A
MSGSTGNGTSGVVAGAGRAPLHVSGAAWATALGTGLDEVWEQLLAGRTGQSEAPSAEPLRNNRVAALPPGTAGDEEPDGGTVARHLAVATATGARTLAGAGLGPDDAGDVLVVIGTSLGPHADRPGPSLYDWVAEAARRLGSRREPVALSTACSSGSDAIAVAADLLTAGVAERCLVGAVDLLTPNKRRGHSRLRTMSRGEPRSFDRDRDGMLLGEAGGFLLLETAAAADARQAPCLGLLTGWGASNNALGPTEPDASGTAAARAMRAALDLAGRSPTEVAVISTHGTGTVLNDAAESAGLALLWPPAQAAPGSADEAGAGSVARAAGGTAAGAGGGAGTGSATGSAPDRADGSGDGPEAGAAPGPGAGAGTGSARGAAAGTVGGVGPGTAAEAGAGAGGGAGTGSAAEAGPGSAAEAAPGPVAGAGPRSAAGGLPGSADGAAAGRADEAGPVAGAGPVAFATKGALGHSLGATGVVEAITVLLALRDRRVPPVPHLERVMDGFPLRLPVGRALGIGGGCGLSQTLGFGGFNTCLLLEPAPVGRRGEGGGR